MIDVPSKIWRPKPENKYVPLDYSDDIDDEILVFTQYGNSVRRKPVTLASTRTNRHFWDADRDNPEFRKHFRLGATVNCATRGKIEMMVQKYWDVFHEAGVRLPVLGFEFTVDTGGSQPVCCRKPNYGHMNLPLSSNHRTFSLPTAGSANVTGRGIPWSSWHQNLTRKKSKRSKILFGACAVCIAR
jgi:hypothetical protein